MKYYETPKVNLRTMYNLLILFFVLSCSSSDDNSGGINPPDNTPVLTRLEISSSNGNQLDLNGINATTLSVIGKDQFNETITISETIIWSSNNNNVTVNSNGNVTAQNKGSSTVSATVGTVSENFAITVIDTTPQAGTFIYVSDAVNFSTGDWKIYKYDENGQNAEVFIDEDLAWPQDIIFLEANNEVLISNLNSGKINRYNATTCLLYTSPSPRDA